MNLQDVLTELANLSPDSPAVRGAVMAASFAANVVGVGWRVFARRKPERVKVNVDAPTGEAVFVRIGEDASGE